MKKRKDSAGQTIVFLLLLLILLLLILALLLGYLVFRPSAISGTVFDDRNGDGIRQQGEVGHAARVVRLVDPAGKEVRKTTTKRDGGYRFDGLGVGTYRVALANASAERNVKIDRRAEVVGIDLGVPPLEPRDQNELRRNHDFWAKKNGGDEDTEKAVDRALEWLANHQLGDGGWTFNLGDCPRCRGQCRDSGDRKDRTAATALALLPFLGRGISHNNSDPADEVYQRTVARGIAFLQNRVAVDGKVTDDGELWTMYSQGLAAIVFAEMCAILAQDQRNAEVKAPKKPVNQAEAPFDDESLRQNAKLVLRFICRAQDPGGGGWRYQPRQPGDTSVVGWQMMALHAGKKNVLNAPGTWQNAINFLDSVQADEGATYGYTDNRGPDHRRSAIGLLCRMYDGWPEKNPTLLDGVSRLAEVGPTRDIYFDYYATQVMFHMGGDQWKMWNQHMKKLLLDMQRQPHGHEAGSWFEGVNGDGFDKQGGRLYYTSLAAMILEVYHRHLRIYRPRD